jgi:hypothetical protein
MMSENLPDFFKHDPSGINTLIRHRPLIMAQYRVQAAHLIHLANKKSDNVPVLIKEIKKTLNMTVLLKEIYHHIDEPDDVRRAIADQAILETILFKLSNPDSAASIKIPSLQAGFSQQLRALVLNTNFPRLTAIRIRRFLLACMTFEWFALCRQPITQIEQFTNPFFSYLGWFFFFPRLFLNVISFSQKVISKPWMSKEKHNLPWYLRAEAYINLHRRGFEFWGDIVWFSGGVLLCFVLVGPVAYYRPFVIVGMQVSDLIMMLARSIIELNRLMLLKNEYDLSIKQGTQLENISYLNALEERITFEKKVGFLMITNNVLMVISVMTMLPVIIAINPLVPILGTLLGLATTIRFAVNNAALQAELPRTNLNLLLKHYETTPVSPAIDKQQEPSLSNTHGGSSHSFFKPAQASLSTQPTEAQAIEIKPSGSAK